MHNATEITIVINDFALIGLVLIFVLYTYVLVQFSPFIKKSLGKLFDIIVKRDRHIGFK